MSVTFHTSCATAGAVKSTIRPLFVRLAEEFGTTHLADFFDGSIPSLSVSPQDVKVGADEVSAAPGGVAAVACRGEVDQGIVPLVSIQVVDNEIRGAGLAFRVYSPVHDFSAPMARMRARADAVVENDPVNDGTATGRSHGMPSRRYRRVVSIGASRLTALKCVPAPPGAVGDRSALIPGQLPDEFFTAMIADEVGHSGHYTRRGVS